MAEETAHFLINNRAGIYLDLTCGGGGHLKYISGLLSPKARLIGVDRDHEAVTAARNNLQVIPQKTEIINESFNKLDEVLEKLSIEKVDGALFDLGLSSYHIDDPERGFSFMNDGPLDMRMDIRDSLTAEMVVNDYTREELKVIFKKFGEEKKADRVASEIVRKRQVGGIKTTGGLRQVLQPLFPGKYLNSSLARLFQAIRIEVNNELDQITQALPKALDCLVIGGRIVVISYHSLEDRIAKRFISEKAKGCTCPDNIPVCVCGKKPTLKVLTRKVVRPSAGETEKNSRAKSARLRAAERI